MGGGNNEGSLGAQEEVTRGLKWGGHKGGHKGVTKGGRIITLVVDTNDLPTSICAKRQ